MAYLLGIDVSTTATKALVIDERGNVVALRSQAVADWAFLEALVAEAAMLTAMIGQTIKLRWKLSLQIRGDGPVRLIAGQKTGCRRNSDPASGWKRG